mgnify:CR=1 FL=1
MKNSNKEAGATIRNNGIVTLPNHNGRPVNAKEMQHNKRLAPVLLIVISLGVSHSDFEE